MSRSLRHDFDSLREGDPLAAGDRPVTEAEVGLFALVTGDRHPQHTDQRWARESPFGERIAHGLLVLSCAVGMLALDPERVVALRAVREAVFKRPVRLGDAIRVEGRIVGKRPLTEVTGLVTCELRILRGDGALAARATLEVVWRRAARPAPRPLTEEADQLAPVLLDGGSHRLQVLL